MGTAAAAAVAEKVAEGHWPGVAEETLGGIGKGRQR